jgi:hypothetical protein
MHPINMIGVPRGTGSLDNQSRCKNSLTSGRQDGRQDRCNRVGSSSRGRSSLGFVAKHLDGSMVLLEIIQLRLVDLAPLAVLIASTMTLLLLPLSLMLTIVLVLVLVVVVRSGRSKQGRTSGILASSTTGPHGLDTNQHIFQGDTRLLVQRLDYRAVIQGQSMEHGNGEQLIIKGSLLRVSLCRAHPSHFLDRISILRDTGPPDDLDLVSKFWQERCTVSLLELIPEKNSMGEKASVTARNKLF